jgi:hypothetical protein
MVIPLLMLLVQLGLGPPSDDGAIPFTDDRWRFEGESADIVQVGGREALRLHNGRAVLGDAGFENGVIEFDMMVTPERGFHGLYFRVGDGGNEEYFYIRPHQSGNEDANQYTPVFNGMVGWQLYFGPWFSAPTEYRFGAWMHVKLVVSGHRADIYIDSEAPVLQVTLKNRRVAGPLVLDSNLTPVHYAGFRYRRLDDPPITQATSPAPTPEAGTVLVWDVSSPFDEGRLATVTTMAAEDLESLTWQRLEVEDRGYANLARVASRTPESNTVLARLRIQANEAGVRTIRFGYSDRVRVYLNGELLYAGDNGYQSRDYRYLGTIGLFDAVPLRLRPGENELLFAVSESFGGWGIMARVDPPDPDLEPRT